MTMSPVEPKRIGVAPDHGDHGLGWEQIETFFAASFSGTERHWRRLAKVAELERREAL